MSPFRLSLSPTKICKIHNPVEIGIDYSSVDWFTMFSRLNSRKNLTLTLEVNIERLSIYLYQTRIHVHVTFYFWIFIGQAVLGLGLGCLGWFIYHNRPPVQKFL